MVSTPRYTESGARWTPFRKASFAPPARRDVERSKDAESHPCEGEGGVYTGRRGGYIVDMNRSPIVREPLGAIRRLTALWALVAIALPAARGPLCTAGGHEAGHSEAAGDVVAQTRGPATATAHDPAGAHGGSHGGEEEAPRGATGLALGDGSDAGEGCHRLMACGVSLAAIDWPDVPASPHPSLAASACRIAVMARTGPSFSPTPPPPRA